MSKQNVGTSPWRHLWSHWTTSHKPSSLLSFDSGLAGILRNFFCGILTAEDWCLQYRFQELNIGWTGLTMAGVEAVVTGLLTSDDISDLKVSLWENL